MRVLSMLFVIILLTGCAAGYQTSEDTDKFSDPTKPQIISMKGNAVDFGGPLVMIRVSELNGFVARDRSSGKVLFAGFVYNGVRRGPMQQGWLNIRSGDELVFLFDGERIATPALTARIDHHVSRGVGYTVDTEYYDYAEYRLTPDQFRKIAKAAKLEFQVAGTNGVQNYPSNRPLLDSFQPNLLKFYDAQIAPHL